MDKNIGKKLDGRYEIVELIGIGGMADVYRATDVVDNKTVAVKILKNEFAHDNEFLRRFRNESKAIAVLSHPNIVKIYDVGFTDKIQFIVMEYIDGITLKEFMEQQGVLKWKDAVHFIVQILRALQHAHDRGIVHRDIKPQNIMLFPDGTIKVMDFGIARFSREEGKTLSDKAIGSVHYISPEQARGDMTDEKSDIYSVGVMLYEMLTGEKPFDAENPVSVAVMHMQSAAIPPREINSSIPEGLEEIVQRAMQKEPEKRYQSAAAMIKDIEEFKNNPSIVFEYKYLTAHAEGSTRYFDPIVPKENKAQPQKRYEEYDEAYGEYEDEDDSRPSLLIPILTAIMAAVIIVAAVFVTVMVLPKFQITQKEIVKMPYLVGMDYETAKRQYDGTLELKILGESASAFAKGQIYEQNKPEGIEVVKNSEVGVYISSGPKMVNVPDIYNLDLTAAVNALESEGLKYVVRHEVNPDVTKYHVIMTEPERNTTVEVGSSVLISVSLGPEEQDIIVPQLEGYMYEDVKDLLDSYKLRIKVLDVDSEEPAGTIIEQSVAADEKVKPDSELIISVSTGNPPSRMVSLTINIPYGTSGSYIFKAYINGTVVSEETIDEISYLDSNSVTMNISGSGVQIVTIEIKNRNTGRSATLAKYSIDFTAISGSKLSYDEDAFDATR